MNVKWIESHLKNYWTKNGIIYSWRESNQSFFLIIEIYIYIFNLPNGIDIGRPILSKCLISLNEYKQPISSWIQLECDPFWKFKVVGFYICRPSPDSLWSYYLVPPQYILNVTPDLPNVFESRGDIKYMKIPIADHWSQNLASYFPKAIQFIGK